MSNSILNGISNKFVDDSFFSSLCCNTNPHIWTGKAGTCFLEDTRGFHRAYIPLSKPRLLLSLVWTIGAGY